MIINDVSRAKIQIKIRLRGGKKLNILKFCRRLQDLFLMCRQSYSHSATGRSGFVSIQKLLYPNPV